jgi:hypothetical protein
MLDVGASRSANRLPSLQSASGESGASAILQNISTQLEVLRCAANASALFLHVEFSFLNF